MFEKILVPLDHSDHSRRSLDVAIQIAKKFGGKITLIHVYSVATPVVMPESSALTSGIPIMPPAYIAKVAEAARESGNRLLEDCKQKVKAEKVRVNVVLKEGHPVQEIIRISREEKFDLIVMGARGVSHIREMLLGSVTDGVMHHVACPVLVIK